MTDTDTAAPAGPARDRPDAGTGVYPVGVTRRGWLEPDPVRHAMTTVLRAGRTKGVALCGATVYRPLETGVVRVTGKGRASTYPPAGAPFDSTHGRACPRCRP